MIKEQLKNHLITCREKLMHTLETIEGEEWQVQVQSEGEQWSVLQMVRHLQDAHRGLTGQVKRIAAGERNLPPDFDIDRWNAGVQRKAAEMLPETALENLKTSHQTLLEVLEGLQEEDFTREGYHANYKKMMPLDEFITIIGSHEVQHGEEIAQALGKN